MADIMLTLSAGFSCSTTLGSSGRAAVGRAGVRWSLASNGGGGLTGGLGDVFLAIKLATP